MIVLIKFVPSLVKTYTSFFTCKKCGYKHFGSSSDRICLNCKG